MKHPAYHLRTNKSVDRLLLVSVLRKLDPECRSFTYYSFGGPFLEDLRVMDHFFPEMKLVSLERHEQTYKRQEFNKFSSRVVLKHITLADFLLHVYNPEASDVFWLDYTDLKYSRFEDFQNVLTKVMPGSVVRITLRAEPEIDLSALKDKFSSVEFENVRNDLVEAFQNEFDKLLPPTIDKDAFTKPAQFATMVQEMVKQAASHALDIPGSAVEYLPIQSTRYRDTTQMVSVTGIVCERNKTDAIREQLKTVRFANFDWRAPERIDIPDLSLKERLHLEKHLPIQDGKDAGEVLFKELNYMIDDGVKRSKNQLAHYADCQRDYPTFIRVSF